MQTLLGAEEYPAFAAALTTVPPVSIRLNPAKPMVEAVAWTDAPVPWHPQGRYLSERPIFTLDPAFHAGAYYVQEASSMFLYEALRQTVDFSKRLKVLDLCAAPGGKSTLIADLLGPDSLLVANEVIRARVNSLRENLEKWGSPQVAVTSAEAEDFSGLEGFFEVIVTDAPCSGEGLFRKDPAAMREWSPAAVELCSARQQRILTATLPTLAPGGVLVYSTCTYNHAENEANVAWLSREFDLMPLPLQVSPEWGIVGTENGYHFYPHRVRGEGFFLAVLKKNAEDPAHKRNQPSMFKNLKPLTKALIPEAARWLRPAAEVQFFETIHGEIMALSSALIEDYLTLDKPLKAKWFGTMVGEFKGKDFVPGHALALSQLASLSLPGVSLSREQAQLFLKKAVFALPDNTPRGWTLARYAGLNLGWMKCLPNRVNNYLPAERRIRMELS